MWNSPISNEPSPELSVVVVINSAFVLVAEEPRPDGVSPAGNSFTKFPELIVEKSTCLKFWQVCGNGLVMAKENILLRRLFDDL